MFQQTNEELEVMVTQNAIPSKQRLGGFTLTGMNMGSC
jgi:hypothetical protein